MSPDVIILAARSALFPDLAGAVALGRLSMLSRQMAAGLLTGSPQSGR
jgi:hypothetical protein